MPDNADAWLNLSFAWYNAGNQEEGKKHEQKALELDPNILQQRMNRSGQ
jgi:tetratricopeptide (TPR) repeat protein